MDLTLSDDQLMAQIAQGDRQAFHLFIQRYQTAAVTTAYRLLGNAHDAQDIAQDAFLRLYHAAPRYHSHPRATCKTWFLRIITNLCLDFFKKKRPVASDELSEHPASDPTPVEATEAAERSRLIHRAIQRLPDSQRVALVLCHDDELSYRQIAEVMGVSVKAVESLLVRAKRTLRDQLADWL